MSDLRDQIAQLTVKRTAIQHEADELEGEFKAASRATTEVDFSDAVEQYLSDGTSIAVATRAPDAIETEWRVRKKAVKQITAQIEELALEAATEEGEAEAERVAKLTADLAKRIPKIIELADELHGIVVTVPRLPGSSLRLGARYRAALAEKIVTLDTTELRRFLAQM